MNVELSIISSKKPYADFLFSNALTQSILNHNQHYKNFVFFCVGTPQVSGDSLGPLIGSQLKKLRLPHTFVYGTWEEPIHALNLTEAWTDIKKKHPGSCFIAIDASFGPKAHLGNICIENRPIFPGRGVGKVLPPVGDISITDIVCTNCAMRYKRLGNIPLSYIRTQANIITSGIFQTLFRFFLIRKP